MVSMKNPYIPTKAIITHIRNETPDTKTFRIRILDQNEFSFTPGQFIQLSVFGFGEAPFSIAGSTNEKELEITVRRIGTVTGALFRKNVGDIVGVRGPFGKGWPIGLMLRRNILIIAGGLGLAPLRSLVHYIILNREEFGKVYLLYGARTPADLLYKDEFNTWSRYIDLHLTVDKGDNYWKGRVGLVTILLDDVSVDTEDTIALQCGPPIMMHFVSKKLKSLGFPDENIYLSLERLMKCGMGFCGRCTVSGRYVCIEGPVFCYADIKSFIEAIPEAGVEHA